MCLPRPPGARIGLYAPDPGMTAAGWLDLKGTLWYYKRSYSIRFQQEYGGQKGGPWPFIF
jgi:hypothetical protein